MGKSLLNRRLTALIIIFCLLMSGLGSVAVPGAVSAAGTYTAEHLAGKAVDFINESYTAGEKIDGYTAYVLSLAGEDLAAGKWARDGESVKGQIEKLADLLGNNNSLITYLLATQNSDGSFGPLANEYGTKAPLQALARVKDDIPAGEAIYNEVQDSIARTVDYFKNKYRDGLISYDVNGFQFDYRCVEALAEAGEDLSSASGWVYDGKSLKDTVLASAGAAAADPSVLDAVYLAKELTALRAVEPDSNDIDILAGAIKAKQKLEDDKVYFGSSIYDSVMVLTALGKAGRLSGIDQQKALNYLNEYRHEHENSWGQAAGAAWGGWYPEEPDLTAQVLTALSYFEGANVEGSEVYQAIQDGLAYLQDIQDVETGAVTHQWDSTFATAETLIALKALGMTYEDYAGSGSAWVKRSKTKTIAQCLLALNEWGDSGRVNKLAGLLAARHSVNGFEDSVYSDMWAYIALGEAGQINTIDAGSARGYILGKQSLAGESYGSWGDTFFGEYYPDFMSTAQAIRALTYLPDYSKDQQIQDAISNGLAYLRSHQQPDGSVYVTQPWAEDPVVDTAEVIITLTKLGLDPASWKNGQGLTPVAYMMDGALNEDGSFGPCKNVLGATEALYAYLLLGDVTGGGNNDPGTSPGTPASPSAEQCVVEIAVVGPAGELLYVPGPVSVSKDGAWGLTVLGALDATGLSYSVSGGLVTSIEGVANSGMNGWMYKVNGSVPPVGASVKKIKDGDRIIWWYSTDINSSGPTWNEVLQGNIPVQQKDAVPANLKEQNLQLPQDLQASEEALSALENIKDLLRLQENGGTLLFQGAAANVVVVNSDRAMSRSEMRALREELAANRFDLSQEVTATSGAIISDPRAEIALSIPAGALANATQITVKKREPLLAADDAQEKGAVGQQVLALYEFGPDGTVFASPVTLSLKIALPPLVRPQDLTLAWYDRAKRQWLPIPAVVDVSRGLLLARINHFSDFAVFAREIRKPFTDVTDTSFNWAKDAIETLAGAGIVAGVDEKRFEPSRAVTRAEFVCLLVRALELKEKTDAKTPFKDIKTGDWYAGALTTAFEAGLIKGYEDGTFGPDNTITREEVVAVLVRALNLPVTVQEITFKDRAEVSAWARNSVATAAARGLIKGFEDGTLRPRETTSRAETAVLISRLIMEFL